MASGTEIERLFVTIQADINGLKAQMGKAIATVDRAEQGMGSALARITTAFSSVNGAALLVGGGVGVASAAVLRGAQAAVQYADDLGDTAAALGLNVEKLQEYRYAATQSGLSAQEMDATLAKLNLQIGSAVREGGAAAAKFGDLGVSIKTAAGETRGTDEVFRDVVQKLSEIPNASERAAAAGDLLGDKLGPKLTALLGIGAGGLDQLGEAARKAGAVMDAETIAKAGKAQDELDALSMVVKAQLTTALVDLSPVLLAISSGIAAIATSAAAAGIALKSMFGASPVELEGEIEDLQDRVNELKKSLGDNYTRALMSPEEIKASEQELKNLQGLLDLTKQKQLALLGNTETGRAAAAPEDTAPGKPPASGQEEKDLQRQREFLDKMDQYDEENEQNLQKRREEAGRKLGDLARDQADELVNIRAEANRRILEDQLSTDAQRIAAIEAARELELAAERTAYEKKLEELGKLQIDGDEAEAERKRMLEEALVIHEANKTAIEEEGARQRKLIDDAEAAGKLKVWGDIFNNLAALTASRSRKMFEIGKAAAISSTLISTFSAAQAAMDPSKGGVAPPLGYALAASVTVAGLARVAAIRSTSFGGGAGGAPGGGGLPVATDPGGGPGLRRGEGGSNVFVQIKGTDMYSGNSIRELFERANEYLGDGGRLVPVS